MAISIDALRALAASGASADMIVDMIAADMEVEKRRVAERRQKATERKRRSRLSRGHGVTERDIAGHRVTSRDTDQSVDHRPAAGAIACGPSLENSQNVTTEFEENASYLLTSLLPLDSTSQKEKQERGEVARARARARPAATRIPDDWQLSDADREFAGGVLPCQQIDIELAKFRDYWLARAGPAAVKHNWSATWRNWCRKAVEINGGKGNADRRRFGYGVGGGSVVEAADRLIEKLGGPEAAARYVPGSDGPKPLNLDHRNGSPNIRRLPS
jgi:hypothetical protein